MRNNYYVICKECNLEHSVEEVTVVNVEENQYGEDVCYFECPVTKLVTNSRVFGERV